MRTFEELIQTYKPFNHFQETLQICLIRNQIIQDLRDTADLKDIIEILMDIKVLKKIKVFKVLDKLLMDPSLLKVIIDKRKEEKLNIDNLINLLDL